MKFLIILLALVVVAYAAPTKDDDQKWNEFKTKHGKSYASASKEKERKDTFLKNAKSIEEHNAAHERGEVTYTRLLNEHSDLTEEEFRSRFAGFKPLENSSKNYKNITVHMRQDPPTNFDLRTSAGVGAVRNQNPCGSCWAFSTISTMEYSYWQKTGKPIDLSEQYLVDCVYGTVPQGCNRGGNVEQALNWIVGHGGVPDECHDPYLAYQKSCNLSIFKATNLDTTEPFSRWYDSDINIKWVLNLKGVLAVGVDASGWNDYGTGVFVSPDYTGTVSVDHAVSLVGYGVTSTGTPYWIVRNQWGYNWGGEGGYIRLDARRHSNGNMYGGMVLSENWLANIA